MANYIVTYKAHVGGELKPTTIKLYNAVWEELGQKNIEVFRGHQSIGMRLVRRTFTKEDILSIRKVS